MEFMNMKSVWLAEMIAEGIHRRYRSQWESTVVLSRVIRGIISSEVPENYPFNDPLPWQVKEKKDDDDFKKRLDEADDAFRSMGFNI